MAQVTTSSISGTVVDGAGKPAIGATVLATHVPSGTQYGAAVDAKGYYRLSNLRPGGPYTVKAQMLGYKSEELKNVELSLGENFSFSTKLNEESMNIGEVVVTADGALSNMNTNRAGIATVVNAKAIALAPSISRSMNDIMRFSPQSTTTSNGFAVGGGNYRQSYVTVDGASFNNMFGIGGNLPAGNAPISLDALDQISVNITPFDVRQSGFTGGAINAVTKAGTNNFTASAYTYFNTDNMQGNRVGDVTVNKNMANYTLWGVSVGGAIVKDKLFFFANYEGEQNISPGPLARASKDGKPNTTNNINRPTAAFLNGVQDYLVNEYGYETGPYQEYSLKVPGRRLMARIDWNISKNHKFNVRFSNTMNKYSASPSGSTSPFSASDIYRGGTDSYGTSIPSGKNRTSEWSMTFKNSRYFQEQNFTSVAAELNSVFGAVGNTLRFTYSRQYEPRTYDGNLMPTVDILDGGAPITTFGLDMFTYGNLRQVDQYIITDEATYNLGKHTFTAGLQLELDKTQNGYLQAGAGLYVYDSWNDFTSGAKPSSFLMSFDKKNPGGPSNADFNYSQFSIYLQDKIDFSDNFKLTGGIRFEIPKIPSLKDNFNQTFSELAFKDGVKYSTDQTPKSRLTVSPRIGFNWDIAGDRRFVLRGGTGIFTGRIPFVWIVSAKGNANTTSLQYKFDPTTVNPYKPDFITNPSALAADLLANGAVGATTAPATPTILSKDLKMPSTWKSSLAFDVQLPWGILGSIDAAYSKDFNGVVVTNVGMKDPTPNGLVISANDKRDLYNNGLYNSSPAKVTPYLLENMKGGKTGNYYSVGVKLQKTVKDFSAMIAYTHSGAKSLSDGIGDQVTSAWKTNTSSVQGSNSHELGYGTYVAPDRLIASIAYKIKGTSLSLFYEGSQLGYFQGTGYSYTRFSYTFSSAVVGDGGASNLIYVPASKEEVDAMNFAANGSYTAQEQKDDFWAYINQDNYLSSRKGKYTERGGAVMPWRNRFDFKFMQDINIDCKNGKRNTIQIGLDIMNVGNLLNKNWGNIQQVNNSSILSYKAGSGGAPGTLNFNKNGSERLTQTFSKFPSLQSTYSMQLSLRYIFN